MVLVLGRRGWGLRELPPCVYFGQPGKKEIGELLKTLKKGPKKSSKFSCNFLGVG